MNVEPSQRLNTGAASTNDPVRERWLTALRAHQSGLPQPVALAMVDAAAKENFGEQLRKIEEALMYFENASLEDLTGSKVRVLVAILCQMDRELEQLGNKLNHLWEQE